MANHWYDSKRKLLKDDPTNVGLDWSNREICASNFISLLAPKKIFDFGCGDCGLSRRIDKTIEYAGFDSIAHVGGITIIDFNVNLPNIEDEGLAVCLGILEYLDNKKYFIDYLYKNFKDAVFSCRDIDAENIISIFKSAGYEITLIARLDSKPAKQSIYYADKK